MNVLDMKGFPDNEWQQTLPAIGESVGGAIDLMDPRPEMINWDTVATISARVARFGGHTGGGEILTIAQHEYEGACAILRETGNELAAKAFLIHDAHETVIGDIGTPIAKALGLYAARRSGQFQLWPHAAAELIKTALRDFKTSLDSAFFRAARLPWPLPPSVAAIVKDYDIRMLRTERDGRMATPPQPWAPMFEKAKPIDGVDLYPWSPGYARVVYRQALRNTLGV